MADTNTTVRLNNLVADSVQTTELNAGNIMVTGAARFAQPIYAEINGAKDINTVSTATSISDTWTVIVSDGTAIHRISFSDLCAAIADKIGIDSTKDYLYD